MNADIEAGGGIAGYQTNHKANLTTEKIAYSRQLKLSHQSGTTSQSDSFAKK